MITRRSLIRAASASLLVPALPKLSHALDAVLLGTVNQASDATYYVDMSWHKRRFIVQPAPGYRADIIMPSVAGLTAPLSFIFRNNMPGANVRFVMNGGDTINGNTEEFYLAGDDSYWIENDWPYSTSGNNTNWDLPDGRPRLRQGFIGRPILAQPVIPPTGDAWVPVTGFTRQLVQMLQCGSSRERVSVSVSVSSTVVNDRVAFTLAGDQYGLVNPVSGLGVEGLASQLIPYSSASVQYEFSWELPETIGYLQSAGFTLTPNKWQLMVKNSAPGGYLVFNPGATVSSMSVSEWSVA